MELSHGSRQSFPHEAMMRRTMGWTMAGVYNVYTPLAVDARLHTRFGTMR